MLPFTLHQLQTLLKVAQKGSIAAAARELHVSDSSVSQQLKAVEEQLGITLFTRSGRRMVPTRAGRAFLEMAAQGLTLLEQAAAYASYYSRSGQRPVVAGANPSWGFYRVPKLLKGLKEWAPDLQVEFRIHLSPELCRLVSEGFVDFAFVSDPQPTRQLRFLELEGEQLVLAAPHDWAPGPDVDEETVFRLLSRYPLVLPPRHSRLWHLLRPRLKPLLERRPVVYEIESFEGIRRAVFERLGVGLVPMDAIQHELDARLVRVLPAPGFPLLRKDYLVWLPTPSRENGPHALFIEVVQRLFGKREPSMNDGSGTSEQGDGCMACRLSRQVCDD